jgi:hypothetical protein
VVRVFFFDSELLDALLRANIENAGDSALDLLTPGRLERRAAATVGASEQDGLT